MNRRRGGRSKDPLIASIVETARREKFEQYAAQIATISISVSLDAIRKGIRSTVSSSSFCLDTYLLHELYRLAKFQLQKLKKKPKTRYDYMLERVRDFQVAKSKAKVVCIRIIYAQRPYF